MSLKKSLFAALVAVSAVALTADTSFGWFGRHGSCGSWGGGWGSGGSWGGSHGSGGSWGGSWGSGGSWGGGSCGSYGGGYAVSYGYRHHGGGYVVASSRPVTTTVIASSKPVIKTKLTLRVPAEAKVTLAGVETKQTGEVRQFATSKLSSGQNWNDYKVVVEVTRDGQTLREERTLKLTGGQDQELAVEFPSETSTQVAAK
jgi:uncharacterized protein (TIGR03000 family)